MKFKLEHLNIGTGFFLFIAGIIYFLQSDYTSALSWSIFGAMYLVMDDYKPCGRKERTFGHYVREVFGVVGFILSIILLLYIIL